MADEQTKAEIRIIKRKKGHGGHHGGAWKVAYADFVTAMMAFFLVMWITGMSQDVKVAVAAYFTDPESFMAEVKAGNAMFSITEGAASSPIAKKSSASESNERKVLEGTKEKIVEMIAATPEFEKLKKYVDIKQVDEGLRIDLLDDKESLFFDSASAKIKPSTCRLLTLMSEELKKLPNKIIISGHTDSRPLNRELGYTNWELSSNRANAARRVMESAGVSENQICQVRGYAATQPRNPKDPKHYSNRRVSITVVMNSAWKEQEFRVLDASETKEKLEKQEPQTPGMMEMKAAPKTNRGH